MQNPKDKLIQFRTSDDLRKRLAIASAITDVPKSQIVREAINEKLARLAKTHPELAA